MEINKYKRKECYFILSLDELKKRLELEDKYKEYFNFKRQVINKAQSEINKHSDLILEYEEIKQGRSVDSIKFIISRKKDAKRAKYTKEQENNLSHDDSLNTDMSPMSNEEFCYLMLKNELRARMANYRVAEKVTNQLLDKYELERIENALDYLDDAVRKGKEIKNKAAYLVNAIQENYE